MGGDVTYSDVKTPQKKKKPIKQSRGSGAAAVYSEVKRDVCYREIVINTNRRRAAEVEMGGDVTYSDVKTPQKKKKPIKQSRGSGAAAVYSEVKRDVCYREIVINTNRRREIAPDPELLYSSVR
ncbi:hypothetical protein PBY51_005710 [Eleginops maclovinus]|uniref:Uncharacterized protein n=1 Tax=Eleginops maclovinus TaxID=56733 RepID=A0AAN7WC71_ELEMC|nr:hypothetical protein PBY51_005710 [Eleginops maclovinus]